MLVPPCPITPWQLAQLASKILLPTSASPLLDEVLELEEELDELELFELDPEDRPVELVTVPTQPVNERVAIRYIEMAKMTRTKMPFRKNEISVSIFRIKNTQALDVPGCQEVYE